MISRKKKEKWIYHSGRLAKLISENLSTASSLWCVHQSMTFSRINPSTFGKGTASVLLPAISRKNFNLFYYIYNTLISRKKCNSLPSSIPRSSNMVLIVTLFRAMSIWTLNSFASELTSLISAMVFVSNSFWGVLGIKKILFSRDVISKTNVERIIFLWQNQCFLKSTFCVYA